MSPERKVRIARVIKSAKILFDIITIEELEEMEREGLEEITETYFDDKPAHIKKATG